MTRSTAVWAALLPLLFPCTAHAGIIGMLWSHARNNVTIRGDEQAGRPVILVSAPETAPCPLQLFRHDVSELDGVTPQNGPQGAALAFGLWFDRACYFKHYDTPGPLRGPERPLNHVVDIERDVFGRPALAGKLAEFKSGALKLALCLQEGVGEQSQNCPLVGYADIQAKRTVYESKFRMDEPMDLGLTPPRPLRGDVRINQAYIGPAAPSGKYIPKRPTLSAKISGLELELAQAFNPTEAPDQGRRYVRFYLYRGAVVDLTKILEVSRQGETWCEVVLNQPESSAGRQQRFRSGEIAVGRVDAGGGSAPFSYGPGDKDPSIKNRSYWSQSISFVPVGTRLPEDTLVSHFACAKPNGNWDGNSGITAAEALQHLRLNGRPFVEFFSDYPGYQ